MNKANLAAIRAAMARILMPEQFVELRVIYPEGRIVSQIFSDHAEFVEAAARASDNKAKGVYFTPNPIHPERAQILQRTKKAAKDNDIGLIRWLLLDFDWEKRPKPSSATKQEKRAAELVRDDVEGFLSSLGWGDPLRGNSGNGYHLMYQVENASPELIKAILNTLDDLYSAGGVVIDTKVGNPSRIWKVYGTAARKGRNTSDRPWRYASLGVKPGGIVPVTGEQMKSLVDRHRKTLSPLTPGPKNLEKQALDDLATYIDAWLGDHFGSVSEKRPWSNKLGNGFRWVFAVCPWNEDHNDRSAFVGLFPNGTVIARCHHNGCSNMGWADLQPLASVPMYHTGVAPESRSLLGSSTGTPHRTDLGNAKRMVRQSAQDLRYSAHRDCWLYFDEKRWAVDPKEVIVARHAKAAVGEIFIEAAAQPIKRVREMWIKHAFKSESVRSIRAMISLASTEPEFEIAGEHLDHDPYLFNMHNGTLDLRKGELHDHDRTDFITKISPVEFDPNATCPIWDKFIKFAFHNNKEVIDFFYRYFGYCLTGLTTEQVLLFMDGSGKNGKSTAFGALMHIMGDYAIQAPPGLLLVKGTDSHPTEQTDLEGTRFVACAEVDKGKRFNEATLKQLTGSDPIRARKMRKDYYQFAATHKFAIIANYKPIIKGNDEGIWRRILRLPWSRTVSEQQRDKDLPGKLLKEAPGIFNRILYGCLEWQRIGLVPPTIVVVATREYRGEMDTLLEFFEDCCVVSESAIVSKKRLYDAYCGWIENLNERVSSYKLFNRQISERGYTTKFTRVEGTVSRCWEGLAVVRRLVHQPTMPSLGEWNELHDQ